MTVLHRFGLFLIDKSEMALLVRDHGDARLVGRNEHAVLYFPELGFVGSVVDSELHAVSFHSDGVAALRIDEAPAS